MTPEVIRNMSAEEGSFWFNFFFLARGLIRTSESLGETRPFSPCIALRENYRIAIEKYDGSKYCEFNQLAEIFSF